MTKSPLVSVLLTTYNRSSYLVHAIESIKNQTLSDWELIIVDDGSSDDTFEVASRYAKSDKRIQAVTQNNSGLATALNTGLALAKGQYVTRQDDDDLCHPYRLECMASHLYRKPELKAVVSASDRMDAEEAFCAVCRLDAQNQSVSFFEIAPQPEQPLEIDQQRKYIILPRNTGRI